MEFRTGVGYDSHRLERDRRLVLGGVEISSEKGLVGHSDADILIHALTDALLGAAGLGDIGELFPNSDPKWKEAASEIFLTQARELLEGYGWRIINIDVVVVIERPKLLPHRQRIRENLARILRIAPTRIGLKAKTAEGVGPCGREEAAEAYAVATLAIESNASRLM